MVDPAFYARFRAQVRARAAATALETSEGRCTYAELDERAHDWSSQRLAGLQPGSAFGWLGLNSVDMVAALLACAQRGIRFVPMNWRLAAPELQSLAQHAGLAAWHADAAFAALNAVQASPHVETQHLDDLLLVYTSGTTGQPKGAVHTQPAMLANIDAAIEALALTTESRTLATLPMFHVGGLCIQVLPTLMAGGVVKLHARFDASAWLKDVDGWHPTQSLMVPATMHAVINHGDWAGTDLASLQAITAGSSIVPRDLIDAFHGRGVPVMQVYGATETGPITLVLRADEAMAHPGSAGRAALGVEVRLVEGELHVRAPNLARGYHRLPHDEAWADGWFKTGDLARIDPDGYFEIVGRRKDMIISGGENIDPAEIEKLVAAVPGVVECAVVGVPDTRWGEVPVLAVVCAPDAAVTADDLRDAYVQRLARFKHPVRTVYLPALPKTALGKVQRTVLARALGEA